MLTEQQRQRLKDNWIERADALSCNAEVRIISPHHSWEIHLIALSPDEEEVTFFFNTNIETKDLYEFELFLLWVEAQIDPEYRPRKASVILKKLQEKYER